MYGWIKNPEASAAQLDVLFNEGTGGLLSKLRIGWSGSWSGMAGGAEFEVLMDLGTARWSSGYAAGSSGTTMRPTTPSRATFLLLVLRARGIRLREKPLGPWLHGVLRGESPLLARASDALCRQREALAAIGPAAAKDIPEPGADGLVEALHTEIDRLPEKYRMPIVLRHLQGRTIDEAARVLGCPAGTVGGVCWGGTPDRLRQRLIRRGPAAPAALARALAPDPFLGGAVPRSLARFMARRRDPARGRSVGDRRGSDRRG